MTEQEHLEVSRKLALAIGWKPEQMRFYDGQEYIGLPVVIAGKQWTKLFDYRFEYIAFRVAERYNQFPWRCGNEWTSTGIGGWVDTPQLAIALSVIAAQGVK